MNVEVVGWNIGSWEIGIAVNEAAVDRIVVLAWDTWALRGGRLRCRDGSADPAEQ